MSGISAGKRLSEAGITDLVILEATDHVGGRMHKRDFGGISVEMGANWVEGVDGGEMNPIWPIVNSTLKLTNFRSDFDHLASNVYKEKSLRRSTQTPMSSWSPSPTRSRGIDSADILINCAQKSMCKYHVQGKYD
uniref:Amine oxidase domain-containing protein n=1 Tax=Aegilops tauschii subsp. strangulata TaxID=200361 RepID=A0A453JCK6_AEGTS